MLKNITTYITEFNGCYIIIKNMHCTRRTQCKEEFLNGVALQKFEHILEKLKSVLTEIAVVYFNNAA